MSHIPQKDAHLILTNSAKFPTKGTQCNGSCVFYFACQNSKDFGECQGFLMLNGESEKLLKRGLTEHDLEYIENAHSVIQRSLENGHHEDASVILRDISQLGERVTQQPTERKSGFAHMLECALGVSTIQTQEPEPTPETRGTSGFSAMLDSSRGFSNTPTNEPDPVERHDTGFLGMLDALRSKTESPHTLRTIDESQFPPLCNPMACPPNYARHCSANRPEHYGRPCIYRTPTNDELKRI